MPEIGNVSGFVLQIGTFIRQSLNAELSRLQSITLLVAFVSPVAYASIEPQVLTWLTIESYLVVMVVCVYLPLRYKLRSHKALPNAKLIDELTMRQIAVLAEPYGEKSRLLDVEILDALQTGVVRFCRDTNRLVPSSTQPNSDQQDLLAAIVACNGRLPRPWNSGFPPNYIKNKSSLLKRELVQLGLHYSDLRVYLIFGIILYIGLFGMFYGWMVLCNYDPDHFTQTERALIIISIIGQFIIFLSVGNRRHGGVRFRTGAGDLLLEELNQRGRKVDVKNDLDLQLSVALFGTYTLTNTPFNQFRDFLLWEDEYIRNYCG